MALGAKELASSIFSKYSSTFLEFHSFNKSPSSIKLGISISPPAYASLKFTISNIHPTRKPGFQLQSSVESVTVEDKEEEKEQKEEEKEEGVQENPPNTDNRRKLFVLNLPWSFSVVDIKKLFSECGGVDDVEIIKQKDGKNRGFAFVTMASGEEAQAAIEKFDSFEVSRRIIRVQFSKRFKKPIRSVTPPPPPGETRHKLYVSNLAWKVRSNNLREFFSSDFTPMSARVVFDNPSGKSAGYGFVSFATKEEAESAISLLDGKELLGRPIRLKFSEKNPDASEGQTELKSDASESKEESSSDAEIKEESSRQEAEVEA